MTNDMPKLIITISGDPGSGKTTIAKFLATKLKAKRIYVGEIRRKLARDKGLTLAELNKYAENHPETDVNIDKKTAKQARQLAKKNIVIVEGRTQFHFLPESIKLYIKVSLAEGAKRIWQQYKQAKAIQRKKEGKYQSLNDVIKSIKNRIKSDKKRYQKYYGLDHTQKKHYDLIIDTTNLTKEQSKNQTYKAIKNLTEKIK